MHEPVSPHIHATLLAVVPSVSKQIEKAEHLLRDEEQKRPVVAVHAAPPQMHSALLAVVPSVSKQSGPVAQRQVSEEHLVVELVSLLSPRLLPFL